MAASTVIPPPATPVVATASDHPGRWVGGLLGALASLALAAGAALFIARTSYDLEALVVLGLLGIPVGFILGRAALPTARQGGRTEAIGMGLLIGLAAPPLGAIEISLGAGAIGQVGGSDCTLPLLVGLFLLTYALPVSLIAAVVTIPVGVVWGLLARVIPDDVLRRARMPAPIAALGVRHLVVVLTIVLVIVGAVQVATTPVCPSM